MADGFYLVCHFFAYLCSKQTACGCSETSFSCPCVRYLITDDCFCMKYCKLLVVFGFAFAACHVQAQGTNPIRDSLAVAVEQLAYHPDSIDLCLKKAAWNMQLEQWNYAQDTYDRVLKLDPNNVAALYYRAYVNEKQGRYNFARIDYTNLLRLVPGNFEAQLGLALLNQKDRHYTEATDQMNRLVSQFPDSAMAYAARGGMEREQKMYELAEFDYAEAVKRDAGNKDYLLNHADLLILLNRKTEAKRVLDRLVVLGIPRSSLMEYYRKVRK